MKGTYCLLIHFPRETDISVGAMGVRRFPAGAYIYVGSALGGIEQRVGRHKSSKKRRRWHIDYLLEKGEVIAIAAIPSSSKDTECSIAKSLLASEEAEPGAIGFGSSDCGCPSHLVYFGDRDPELVAETLTMVLSTLQTAYPRTV